MMPRDLFKVCIPVFTIFASLVWADLSVTPALVELTLEKGQGSGSFTIANTGKAPMRVRASYVHFVIDESGKLAPAKLDSTSLANWIKVSPQEFAIQPEGSRQVRFGVSVPPTLPDGSYWGGLEFRPVTERDTSSQSQVHTTIAVLVPILADHGKPDYQWDIVPDSTYSKPSSKGVYVYTLLRNTGNGRVPQRGSFQVKNDAGEVIYQGETARLSLFPYSQRYFASLIPAEVAPGSYEFSISYSSDRDNRTVSGKTRVEIPDQLPEPETRAKGGRKSEGE